MSCAVEKMIIRTLYQDDEITLQRLIITVGTCKMTKFRQITNIDGELDVREVKELPHWFVRDKKLKQLGL
jgi:hypothetical protein